MNAERGSRRLDKVYKRYFEEIEMDDKDENWHWWSLLWYTNDDDGSVDLHWNTQQSK